MTRSSRSAPPWVCLLALVAMVACGGAGGQSKPAATTTTAVSAAAGTYATPPTLDYRLVLVVAPRQSSQLAAFVVSCGRSALPSQKGLSGVDIPITEGRFVIDNADVRITGRVTGPMAMDGTLEAKSRDASSCPLPASATWVAHCGEPTGFKSLVIAGKAVPVGDGPC